MAQVPVVDIKALVEAVGRGDDIVTLMQREPEVKFLARALHEGFCQHGYCLLDNHGLSQHVVDSVYSSSKEFFDLDPKTKVKYARAAITKNHGWDIQASQKLNDQDKHGDLKEAFNFNPSVEKGLPTEVEEMEDSFKALFDSCHILAKWILDLLGVALGLEDPRVFRKLHKNIGKKGSHSILRALIYPAASNKKEGQAQCGAHTDFGTISMLFQDIGGLQVKGKDGEFREVPFMPGKVVVIPGDIMQRWTADRYMATEHRVVVSTEYGVRQSLVFFCHPDDETLITPMDGSPSYPPVKFIDHLTSRLTASY